MMRDMKRDMKRISDSKKIKDIKDIKDIKKEDLKRMEDLKRIKRIDSYRRQYEDIKNKKVMARKNKAQKRKLQIVRLSMCLALIALCIGFTIKSIRINVNAYESKDAKVKYYQSIQVQNHDTLWDIAEKYAPNEDKKSYIENIAEINHIDSNKIVEGTNLVIYYYADAK